VHILPAPEILKRKPSLSHYTGKQAPSPANRIERDIDRSTASHLDEPTTRTRSPVQKGGIMNTEQRTRSRYHRCLALPLFVFVIAWVVSPGVVEAGACIRAFIDETVALPDGSLHPPGTLRICLQPYTPVAALHETSIDGRTIGLFQSRFQTTENPPEDPRPVIIFRRDSQAGLTLLGYTLPASDHTAVYWLDGNVRSRLRHGGAAAATDLASLAGIASAEIRSVHAAFR
jgi:hypothetical protein